MDDGLTGDADKLGAPASPPRSCNGCKYALFQDYGYSNYTTEGTEFFCMVNAHPADGFDRWFGEDHRLDFAADCPRYEDGEPVCLDVDGEEIDALAGEQKVIYEAYIQTQRDKESSDDA